MYSRRIFITLILFFNLISFVTDMEMEKFRPIKADIVLAIDTAVGDQGRSPELLDVEVIQHFLRKITTAFPVSSEDSRIAVVEFGSLARVRLSLNEGVDREVVHSIYDDVSDWYDDEGIDRQGLVDYEAMFRLVSEVVFTVAEGDRPDAPNLLMILTLVPSFDREDPFRWRARARRVARGSVYNYSDPVGTVITTGYATQRGTHLPKFTLTRGVGTFETDAWYYQDFNDVLHNAVVHLRHAVRSGWVDAFYSPRQMRQVSTFDYTTCRVDPAFVAKIPTPDDYNLFVADIVFAIEIDRAAPSIHHDWLRTLVLNVTRHLPISPNLIRFSAAEFDRDATYRILASCHHPSHGLCLNRTALFKTLTEKWVPQTSSRFRALQQESLKDNIRIDGASASSNVINLRALGKSLQKALNQSGRVPQVLFVAIVFPQTTPPSTFDVWYRRFLKVNGQNLKGGADAYIVTSGNSNQSASFTAAISSLSTVESLEMETAKVEDVRGNLYDFVVNVTKAAVRRCGQCYFDFDHQCVIDVRPIRQNVSGIEFVVGRFCQNVSGVSRCSSDQVCKNECERRPWGRWGFCWPVMRKLFDGKGFQDRRRKAIGANDTDSVFYRYCPIQKRRCDSKMLVVVIATLPIFLSIIFG